MTVNFDFLDAPSLGTRPYIPPTVAQSATEQALSKRVQDAFMTATIAAKTLDWAELGQHWAQNGWNGSEFRDVVGHTFTAIFSEAVLPLLMDSALHGSATAQQDFTSAVPVREDLVITPWGQVYSNKLALQLAMGSEMAINDVVNTGLNARLPASALADRARTVYGLDQRSATTFAAYAANKTLPRSRTLLDVAAHLLLARAHIMADNEVFAALNFGRQITYMEAQNAGLLDRHATKTWVTALDERVCPVCKPMDGVTVPMTGLFDVMMPLPKTGRGRNRKSTQHVVPPVHPLCRCTIVPTERIEHGIITRTARFDVDPHKRGRLFSDAGDLIFKAFKVDERRDTDGRWTKMAEHLNGAKTTTFHQKSTTDHLRHLMSTSYDFDEVFNDHVFGVPKEDLSAEEKVALVEKDPILTDPIHAAAMVDTRTMSMLRDVRFQQQLFAIMAKPDAEVSPESKEAAKAILESPQYNLMNSQNPNDVLRLTHGAELWSNTIEGRNLVRNFAESGNAGEMRALHARSMQALADAVDAAPTTSTRLYRGISLRAAPDPDVWKPGATFDLPMTSFTSAKVVASYYAEKGLNFTFATQPEKMAEYRSVQQELLEAPVNSRKASKLQARFDALHAEINQVAEHKIVFILDPGAKALHITPLTLGTHQAEWISKGKFTVQEVHRVSETRSIIRIAYNAERAAMVLKADNQIPEDDPVLQALMGPMGPMPVDTDRQEETDEPE